MSIEKGLSPEVAINSLTEAIAMPREFRAHTKNTHFYKSTEKRTYKYSVFEVHDVQWDQPEVGSTGSVGAVLISKVNFMENKKNNAIQLMTMVLLDEVEIDVMPHEKFIVYHMKAYMDRAQPRPTVLLLHCAKDPETGKYKVDWHVTTLIHHVTKNHGPWDREGGGFSDGSNKTLVSDFEESNPTIVPTAWQLLNWKGGDKPHLKARLCEAALAEAPDVIPKICAKTGRSMSPRRERNVVSPLKVNGMFNERKIQVMRKAADLGNKGIMQAIDSWFQKWDNLSLDNGGFVGARDEDDVVQRCGDRGKACQEGRDKAKLKRDEALKVTATIAKRTKGVPKQAKQNLSPSQEIGMVTPRDGNNVPKASPSSTGDASALGGVLEEYRQRIVQLQIDIEDLKAANKNLSSDKTKLLLNFAQIQAQYGKAVGMLAVHEQFRKEDKGSSSKKSGDQSGNITEFKDLELPAGLSDE